jgi:AcrR family transcriptional regulator
VSSSDGTAAAGSPGRPRSERAQTAVQAAVIALLDEVGYQQLTVEAVAARAGVGKTTIYRWWATKPALVIDALAASIAPAEVRLSGDSRRDVRDMLDRMSATDVGPTMAGALPVLVLESRRDPDSAQRLAALLGPRRAADSAVLLAATARGDLPPGVDVGLLVDAALGALLLRRLRGEDPTESTLDALADLLLACPS